jgi:hypothetical protein
MSKILTEVDKLSIDLWTARDMLFMINKSKGVGFIPRFTECYKPVYNHSIKDYLNNMEAKGFNRPGSNPNAVCVKLEGMLRYVWRTDVLTKDEYDERRKCEKESTIRIFR